jgi:hypothetical protein
MQSRNCKTPKKEHEKTQKQINKPRKDFNKYQSETKDTIKRGIHELKVTTQNITEKLKKIWKTSEEKNQTEILDIKCPFSPIKNTVENNSCKIEQVEDRISEQEDKIEIKEKTKNKT